MFSEFAFSFFLFAMVSGLGLSTACFPAARQAAGRA
jgi:hypothetical protein